VVEKIRRSGLSRADGISVLRMDDHEDLHRHAKEPGPWIEQISKRRPVNVVSVALANKMARMIWAILAHDREYQKGYVSVKPRITSA
jgi:hypothetical protein